MSREMIYHVEITLDDRPPWRREISVRWPAESAATAIERSLGLLPPDARAHVLRVDVDVVPYEAWVAAEGG
jgi:DNA-directed RNA polymerase specialized sigma24 family protein